MKIFKKKQIKLKEDNTSNDVPVINIDTNGNAADAINAANNNATLKKMKQQGGNNFNVQFTNTASTKPVTATTYSSNEKEAEEHISKGDNTVIPLPNLESKIYTKKSINEKRLANLRKKSVPFTKLEIGNLIKNV